MFDILEKNIFIVEKKILKIDSHLNKNLIIKMLITFIYKL